MLLRVLKKSVVVFSELDKYLCTDYVIDLDLQQLVKENLEEYFCDYCNKESNKIDWVQI
jgi:uncharacterized protein YijF (DUF1287 family)